IPLVFVEGGSFIPGTYKEIAKNLPNIDQRLAVAAKALVMTQGKTTPVMKDNRTEQLKGPVRINDFYIGKYEVTIGEFRKFIDDTGYKTTAEKAGNSIIWRKKMQHAKGVNWRHNANGKEYEENSENHPVIHVSHDDAIAYCN